MLSIIINFIYDVLVYNCMYNIIIAPQDPNMPSRCTHAYGLRRDGVSI